MKVCSEVIPPGGMGGATGGRGPCPPVLPCSQYRKLPDVSRNGHHRTGGTRSRPTSHLRFHEGPGPGGEVKENRVQSRKVRRRRRDLGRTGGGTSSSDGEGTQDGKFQTDTRRNEGVV